jgi:hypothetical protein
MGKERGLSSLRFLSAAELFLWTTTASCLLLFLLVGRSQSFTTSIQAQRHLHSAEAQRQYIFTTHFKNNRGIGNNNDRASSSSSNNNHLAMHMLGHSHDHQHKNDHQQQDTDDAATTNDDTNHNRSMTTPRSRRRRLQVVLAMATTMLVQPLWKQQQRGRGGSIMMPSSSHWLATVVASIFVYIAQPIAVHTMVRFRQWMHGISRHTPRYAPDSAADRVTLLGYVVKKEE